MKYIKKTRFDRFVSVLACLLSVLMLSGCNKFSWHALWSRSEPKPNEQLVIEREDGDNDDDVIFQGAVEYTGQPHSGTDIYYVGTGENKNHIIVIDPGHQSRANTEEEPIGPGATDTKMKVTEGARSDDGLREYELNLAVSLLLRDILIQRGYSVVMIRETNEVDISNSERAQIANKYHASAFVRVHANSSEDKTVRGVQVLCQSPLNIFPCKAHYPESRQFAEIMMEQYCESTKFNNLSIVESDTMAGINYSTVPTVIVEMGFLSNEAESHSMSTAFFRRSAAVGMANGIDAFISSIEEESMGDTSETE